MSDFKPVRPGLTLADVNLSHDKSFNIGGGFGNMKEMDGAVSGKNGSWTCPDCGTRNTYSGKENKDVRCSNCGQTFGLQVWDSDDPSRKHLPTMEEMATKLVANYKDFIRLGWPSNEAETEVLRSSTAGPGTKELFRKLIKN